MEIITITQKHLLEVRYVYVSNYAAPRAGASFREVGEELAEGLKRKYGNRATSVELKLETKEKGRERPLDIDELKLIRNQLNISGFSSVAV